MSGGSPSVKFADRSKLMVLGAGTATGKILTEALSPHVSVIGDDTGQFATSGVSCTPRTRAGLRSAADRRLVAHVLSTAKREAVSLIIPTRNIELQALSDHRKEFAQCGIDLLVERPDTLETCLDKFQLMAHCAQDVDVPLTIVLDGALSRQQFLSLGLPFAVESRFPLGSRVRLLITEQAQLDDLPQDGSLIASQIAQGSDFAIEVLSRADGHVVATVPQVLRRAGAGQHVPGPIVADRELQDFARRVAEAIGVTHIVSVVARRQDDGVISLLDVVPRFVQTVAGAIAGGVNLPVLAAAAALGAELPDSLDFQNESSRYSSAA
ncbi:MAG: hypothetical protein JWM76_5036 [Pseudonocardiales bacterium]|nr:hypothetical protein [Pseudonocardiales bacterium]